MEKCTFPPFSCCLWIFFPVIGLYFALDLELLSDLSSEVGLMFLGGDHGDIGAMRLAIENGRGKE